MPDLQNIIGTEGDILRRGAGGALDAITPAELAASAPFIGAFATVTGRPVAGFYYGTPASGLTVAVVTLNRLYLTPWLVTAPCSLDRIAAEITTGAASAVVRLGIYATAADGKPGDLVVDAGTIDGNSVAIQELSLSRN